MTDPKKYEEAARKYEDNQHAAQEERKEAWNEAIDKAIFLINLIGQSDCSYIVEELEKLKV